VLFDELEKAHPDVLNVLLQVLDEGRLTDAQGREVDFRNTIVLMTSNVGAHVITEALQGGKASAAEIEERVQSALRGHFRPEFINRIDEVVVFQALREQDMLLIVDLQLESLTQRLRAKKLSLHLDDQAKRVLARQGYDPIYGARPLKRAIQQRLENPLAQAILNGDFPSGSQIVAVAEGDELALELAS